MVSLIGEPFVADKKNDARHYRQKTEIDDDMKRPAGLPPKNVIKNSYLYNSSKAENIVREILKEFEPVFVDTFAELMRKKLGISEKLDSDMEILIGPLLQIMTECQVNYSKFFSTLQRFDWREPACSASLKFQDEGIHSKEALGDNSNTDLLTLVLAAHLRVINETSKEVTINEPQEPAQTLRVDGKSSQKSPLDTYMSQQEIASLAEIASRFRFWALVYAERLKSQNVPYDIWRENLQIINPARVPMQSDFEKLTAECEEVGGISKTCRDLMHLLK